MITMYNSDAVDYTTFEVNRLMRRSYLRKKREHKSISQQKLADLIGVSASAIGMIEQGRMDPSWDVAQKLEKFFNVKASTLLKIDGDDE
jgi:putative transcriptional regulator